jgi:hypothetical protein
MKLLFHFIDARLTEVRKRGAGVGVARGAV